MLKAEIETQKLLYKISGKKLRFGERNNLESSQSTFEYYKASV